MVVFVVHLCKQAAANYKLLMTMAMMMVVQHIRTMTKSHHGGNMSVMDMVGFCHNMFPPSIILMMIDKYITGMVSISDLQSL